MSQPEQAIPSSLCKTAYYWSQLPDLLKEYEDRIDAEAGGIGRIFGYASIIDQHNNEKPGASQHLPNERAILPGMEVAMNILAVGEHEFRATNGYYASHYSKGKLKKAFFANIGIYAGIEPALEANGHAQGINITAYADDRRQAITAYLYRELGNPPDGIKIEDIFSRDTQAQLRALAGTPDDALGMYKLCIADTQGKIRNNVQKVPALVVATNEQSKFAVFGLSDVQTAHMVLDGVGYRRFVNNNTIGGSSLDYFKRNVVDIMRKHDLHQPRIEAVDKAVTELAQLYHTMHSAVEEGKSIGSIVEEHPQLHGLYSPYFAPHEASSKRNPIDTIARILQHRKIPKTAEEKFAAIANMVERSRG